MTIWLLAVVMLASLAALGYRQGVVRVGCSFVGIVAGALLAVPLGSLAQRPLIMLGVKDVLLSWALGPLLVFAVVLAVFKIAGAALHQKVEVHFKYHTGDLQLALWERLHRRLGLCLGLFNGAAYLILIAWAVYVPSYLTVQLASSESDPRWMRLLDTLGRDLHSTGFAAVARAVDSTPQIDFDMADLAGLLYHNPLCEARLVRYPAFLDLGERAEFQNLGSDQSFAAMRLRQEPVMAVFDYSGIQAIYQNRELLKDVWNTVVPNLSDLILFLQTDRSPKYDGEHILGRWDFNKNASLNALRRAKPNLNPKEIQQFKEWLKTAFNKTGFVATTSHLALIKNLPPLKLSAGVASRGSETIKGQWQALDGKYQLTLSGEPVAAVVEGDRLTVKAEALDLVFSRED